MNVTQTKIEILDYLDAGDYDDRSDLLKAKTDFLENISDLQLQAFELLQAAMEKADYFLSDLRVNGKFLEVSFTGDYNKFKLTGEKPFVEIKI